VSGEWKKYLSPLPHTAIDNCLMKAYFKSHVARHFKAADGWIILNEKVYDVSNYINSHPGGGAVIRGYLGREASPVFNVIAGHMRDHVIKLLDRFHIGSCTNNPDNTFFNEYENYCHTLLKAFASLDMQYTHKNDYPLNLLYNLQAHHQFCCDHLVTIQEDLIAIGTAGGNPESYRESYKLAEHLKRIARLDTRNKSDGDDIAYALKLLKRDLVLIESLLLFFLDFSESTQGMDKAALHHFIESQYILIKDWTMDTKKITTELITMLN
jgi:hypothetical protein